MLKGQKKTDYMRYYMRKRRLKVLLDPVTKPVLDPPQLDPSVRPEYVVIGGMRFKKYVEGQLEG